MASKDPLAGIDEIDWASLNHAYGEASDVPPLLRQICSSEEDDRRRAYWALYGNIYQQGTRYQASSVAVPFLYRLLDDPEMPEREGVLDFLISLAIGLQSSENPLGELTALWRKDIADMKKPDWPEKQRERLAKWVAEASNEAERERRQQRASDFKYGADNHAFVEYRCYETVQEGLDSIFSCLEDDSATVRSYAAYALAWFPDKLPEINQALFALLDTEKDTIVRATALFSLAVIQSMAEDYSETETVSRLRAAYSEDDANDFIQLASSLGLVKLRASNPEQLGCVLRTLADEEHLESYISKDSGGIPFPFSSNNISTLTALCSLEIGHLKGSDHPEVTRALLSQLPHVSMFQILEPASMALRSAFNGVRPDKVTDFNQLTPIQKETVEALSNVPTKMFSFANFLMLLREWGLPSGQPELQKLVKGLPEYDSKL